MEKLVKNALIRNILVIALGVVIIVYPRLGPNIIIMVIGAMLALPALLALIGYYSARRQGNPLPGYIAVESVGAFIMGLWLMILPSFFSAIITIALGVILFIAGIVQIISLARAGQARPIPAIMYIIPVIVVIAGVITFFNPFDTVNAIMIIFGISAVVYGVTDIVRYYRYH